MMAHTQHLSFESLVKMDHFQKEPPLNLKGTTGAKGSEIPVRLNVRFGSLADMCGATRYVRFTPKSDAECVHFECPLWVQHVVEGQEDNACGAGSTL